MGLCVSLDVVLKLVEISKGSLNNCVKLPTKFEVKVVSGVRLLGVDIVIRIAVLFRR